MKATPEMIAAGAQAARKYMDETGGNNPAVIWDAMWAAQPQQEPVATVIGKFLTRKDELRTCIEPELPLGTKLYTTPPAHRKPLTDEDCTRIYNEANGITIKNPPITTERIFKAMRAAHGIKENT